MKTLVGVKTSHRSDRFFFPMSQEKDLKISGSRQYFADMSESDPVPNGLTHIGVKAVICFENFC